MNTMNHPHGPRRLLTQAVLACVVALGLTSAPSTVAAAQLTRVYVGTYTSGKAPASQGIYLCELDPLKGSLASRGLAAEVTHPSFLALHPNRRFLYAVNETSEFGGNK